MNDDIKDTDITPDSTSNITENTQPDNETASENDSTGASHHHSESHHHHHHGGSHHDSSSHHHHHRSYSGDYHHSHSSSGHGSRKHRSRKYRRRCFSKRRKAAKQRKRGSMKKSKSKLKLIIASVICSIALLVIGGALFYEIHIVPKYIKPALSELSFMLQDEKFTNGITREIRRLYNEGLIYSKEVEDYLMRHPELPDRTSAPKNDSEAPVSPQNNVPESGNTNTDDGKQRNSTETSVTGMGVAIVNVRDENSTDRSNSSYYGTSGSAQNNQSGTPSDTISVTELQTLSQDELYERAKKIMTPSDFAMALSLRPKLDLGKVKELRSDSQALLEYVQSALTPDEYSTMLTIYAKYANHLTQ